MIKLPDEKQALIADCQADIEDLKRSIDRCDAIGTSDYLHHLQSRLKRQYLALESLESEVQRLNATAHPVSDGWVKCSERMPLEKSGKMDEIVVLVTDGNSVGMAACYSGDLPKPWVSFTSYGDVHGTDITHWMPLPAVPGGQDD